MGPLSHTEYGRGRVILPWAIQEPYVPS